VSEVVRGGHDNVGRGVSRHGGGGWEPRECVCYSFGVGVPGPYAVTHIVSHGYSQIPAFERVWCPCASGVWLFVYKHIGAQWGQGCPVEME
jgi:hypothetical protein